MSNCIFCKIISKEIPCTPVYEDDLVLAFRDIDPKAPSHIVVVPKFHTENVHSIEDNDMFMMAALFTAVKKVVLTEGLVESGYRLVINSGKDGGQSVDHLHIHILAKRALAWPPG